MTRSPGFQSFLVGVGILVVGMLNSVILSRWLGPTGRGEIAAVLLWPTLLTYLGITGAIQSLVYYSARPNADTRSIFANSLVFTLIVSLVLLPLGFVAMPLLLADQAESIVTPARLFLLNIPLLTLTEFASSLLRGKMRIGTYNVLRAVIPVGYLLGTVALYVTDALDVWHVVVLQLALLSLKLIASFVLLHVFDVAIGIRPDIALAKQMFRYGGQVHVGSLSQLTNWRLDQTLMAAWLPPSELGLYVVAVSTSQLLLAPSQALQLVALPKIAAEVDQAKQQNLLRSIFQGYWIAVLFATPVLGVLLYWAIPIIYGTEFRAAVWPAEVLVVGSLLMGAKEVLTTGTRALGQPWLSSKAELVAVVATVVLLALLLPRIGIMGAAITSVVAYGLALGIIAFGIREMTDLTPRALFVVRRADIRDAAYSLRRLIGSRSKGTKERAVEGDLVQARAMSPRIRN